MCREPFIRGTRNRVLAMLLLIAVGLASSAGTAHATGNTLVTDFVNDPANWTRLQDFLNGSPTYANGEAALATGTDGAFLEDSYYLLRAGGHIVPTADELLWYGVSDVPLYGAAFGAGFVVGTALDKWLHISSSIAAELDSRTVDPWHVAQCDWAGASTGWTLTCSAVPSDYGWTTSYFPDPDCSTQWHGCLNPVTLGPDTATWNDMAQIARLVHHGTVTSFRDGSGNPAFRRTLTRAQMAAEFHGDSTLQPYTGQAKVKNVPIGTPVNVQPTSAPAGDWRTKILANDEAAQGIVHIVTTENPRPGDPSVPAPGNECALRVDDPHTSSGTPGAVLAKGYVTCTYATTVTVAMKLWKCDSPPVAGDEILLDTGAWGCSRVGDNVENRTTVAGIEAAPVYVPPTSAPPVAADGKWFIALGTCVQATPSVVWSNVTQPQ